MFAEIKKFLLTVLISTLAIGLFFPLTAGAQSTLVAVAEGGIDFNSVIGFIKKEAKTFCENEGGHLTIEVVKNDVRIEIDGGSGTVLGAGAAELNFSQKCPGSLFTKLIKGNGAILASVVFTGSERNGHITGRFNMELGLPTLISFKTSLTGLPWRADLAGGYLNGSMDVTIDQFEFEVSFPFRVRVRQEEGQFITPASKKEGGIKRDIADATEKVSSHSYRSIGDRQEGRWALKSIWGRLPMDKRPWDAIDPIPEFNALLELFNAYMVCVDVEAKDSAIGGGPWTECVNAAGDILEQAQTYARLSKPRETASVFYLQLADGWDRLRYQTNYVQKKWGEKIYDKVGNCERAKEMARVALSVNPRNSSATEFLNSLTGKGGCDGMPLFGINSEQIQKDREEALKKAQEETLEESLDLDDKNEEFIEELDADIEDYEEIDVEEAIENTTALVDEAKQATLNNLGSLLKALKGKVSSAKLEKATAELAELEKISGVDFEKQNNAIQKAQKSLADITEEASANPDVEQGSGILLGVSKRTKDFFEATKDYFEFGRDLYRMGKVLKSTPTHVMFRAAAGNTSYGLTNVFGDVVCTVADYMENSKNMSHEDAVIVSVTENIGVGLVNNIPILRAAEFLTATPDKILNAIGIGENNWSRKWITGQVKKGSPSNLVKETNKAMVDTELSEFGSIIASDAEEIGKAKGILGKAAATGRFAATLTGAGVVGAARAARDGTVALGNGIANVAAWIDTKFF